MVIVYSTYNIATEDLYCQLLNEVLSDDYNMVYFPRSVFGFLPIQGQIHLSNISSFDHLIMVLISYVVLFFQPFLSVFSDCLYKNNFNWAMVEIIAHRFVISQESRLTMTCFFRLQLIQRAIHCTCSWVCGVNSDLPRLSLASPAQIHNQNYHPKHQLHKMSSVSTVESPTIISALNTESDTNGEAKRLHHIPRPSDKEIERKWLLEQMAGAFRIFAKLGFSDGSSGHISVRGMSFSSN